MRSQVVSFHCVLKNNLGSLISSTFNKDVITEIEGKQPGMLEALARGLKNLKKGEKRKISLAAKEAYGFYDPNLLLELSRSELSKGKELGVGDEVRAQGPSGEPKTFRVVQANARTITLDGNHPLAGQDLVFEIEATEARDATSEELAESSLEQPVGENHRFH